MIELTHNLSEPVIECVLNFSEGSNRKIIKKAAKILSYPGNVFVLNIDSGRHVNRTVFTIVGYLEQVLNQLVFLLEYTQENISIEIHEGVHPRIGLLDVIPFIPIQNIDSGQLVNRIGHWAEEVASSFDLPLFFYGSMSSNDSRKDLHFFRRGGLSRLNNLIASELKPDAGPLRIHNVLGASCITVRDFMGAYNVNLDSPNLDMARQLANRLKSLRDQKSKTDLDLSRVKFLGWYIEDYDCCQISTNIYDLYNVKLFDIYNLVTEQAALFGLKVTGSELIGMIPRQGICSAKQDIQETLRTMNLGDKNEFRMEERILNDCIADLNWQKSV